MNKLAFGILAFVALAACCFVPLCETDAAGEIEHEGTYVFKVSTNEKFTIRYDLEEGQEGSITFNAKVTNKAGETVNNAVSPSTSTLQDGNDKSLTVMVPSTAGDYTLVVEFLVDDVKVDEKTYAFKAVNPIVLTVNFKVDDMTLDLEEFGVYFYIDGEKMEDSYTTISLSANGTGKATYNWIADPDKSVSHTFYVEAVGSTAMIEGLDEVHVFYASDNDYTWIIVLSFVVLIVLIIYAIRVYRKPVKNFGKPKARR
jgi:hypothetical protein